MDQGTIPEDTLCRVNRPSSLALLVARHLCKDTPPWILCVDHQDLTAPILTSHLTHPDNQLWTYYIHSPSVPQVRG